MSKFKQIATFGNIVTKCSIDPSDWKTKLPEDVSARQDVSNYCPTKAEIIASGAVTSWDASNFGWNDPSCEWVIDEGVICFDASSGALDPNGEKWDYKNYNDSRKQSNELIAEDDIKKIPVWDLEGVPFTMEVVIGNYNPIDRGIKGETNFDNNNINDADILKISYELNTNLGLLQTNPKSNYGLSIYAFYANSTQQSYNATVFLDCLDVNWNELFCSDKDHFVLDGSTVTVQYKRDETLDWQDMTWDNEYERYKVSLGTAVELTDLWFKISCSGRITEVYNGLPILVTNSEYKIQLPNSDGETISMQATPVFEPSQIIQVRDNDEDGRITATVSYEINAKAPARPPVVGGNQDLRAKTAYYHYNLYPNKKDESTGAPIWSKGYYLEVMDTSISLPTFNFELFGNTEEKAQYIIPCFKEDDDKGWYIKAPKEPTGIIGNLPPDRRTRNTYKGETKENRLWSGVDLFIHDSSSNEWKKKDTGSIPSDLTRSWVWPIDQNELGTDMQLQLLLPNRTDENYNTLYWKTDSSTFDDFNDLIADGLPNLIQFHLKYYTTENDDSAQPIWKIITGTEVTVSPDPAGPQNK